MGAFRLRIEFEDRTGMVLDACQVIAKYNLSITALEVLPNLMYFELECDDERVKKNLILDLAPIPNIQKVEEVKYCPSSKGDNDPFHALVGESETLKKAVFRAKLVANSSCTVLLTGESGTGKEVFARALHLASKRAVFPFMPLNCAAFPENLLESELFGYVDGAFTGAKKGGKPGLLEAADKGTVFLDEIGDLSLNTQAKLLRALQDKKIRRVGAYSETPVDVRIIAATNRDLEKMVKAGEFREDLFYRLNVVPIKLPPLRERRADIPLLAEHFLAKFARLAGQTPKTLTPGALALLVNYDWPGNVRELENLIERAVNLTPGLIIDIENLDFEKENLLELPTVGRPLKAIIEEFELKLIKEAIKKHGSIRKAAKALGISHSALLKKLRRPV
ncbi:sigma 54-interacting transcriptional regulator [Zhaonella formicivorans]|uniref:sigma 54-interacting transcriptional regulator n=1 Tax=Zhaonella formicivorans TaxID=2528593 RepID=UPI001D0F4AE2|nr:sigma 54-interacting transcriptional regulator [Zhaonella formicivorans]